MISIFASIGKMILNKLDKFKFSVYYINIIYIMLIICAKNRQTRKVARLPENHSDQRFCRRSRIVASCARVAVPPGLSSLAFTPVSSPLVTAQRIGSAAQDEIFAVSE